MPRHITPTKLAAIFAAASVSSLGGQANAAEAVLRVVDVGNAMCVVAKVPGDHFMLYDAGDFETDECRNAVREIVGTNDLDLVVLSHSDEDHIGELAPILGATNAQQIVWTGARPTSNRVRPVFEAALRTAEARHPGSVRNLGTRPLPNTRRPRPGQRRAAPLRVRLGNATATFVTGFHSWTLPSDPGKAPDDSEKRNAISIVVKFEFGGKSVLLTGDTIGRRRDESPTACRDAEDWMVHSGNVPLKSDVLVGQHHGGDNASSRCFVEAVSPAFVVFPAGNSTNDHPRAVAVERYLNPPLESPVDRANIFRTDRGDDEGEREWDGGREAGCRDRAGDDDVEIVLSDRPGTPVQVRYRLPRRPCP